MPTESTQHPVAVVAGASRGLGLAIARSLLDSGYRVAIAARDSEELAAAQEQLSPEVPDQVDVETLDVADADAVHAWVGRVERELGPVEVAISVAGIIQVGPAEEMTRDDFRQAVDIMLWGPVNLAEAVLPGMRERRSGRIGVVSSIGGAVAAPHLLPYCTAKFGANGFAQGLAAELAGTGVTATAILPGLMRTGSHERAQFAGDAPREYAWFAPGASLPLISMDAERAAQRIVAGVLRGRPVVVLTPLAKVGIRVHGVMPATTVRVMGVVNRLLPSPDPDPSGPHVLEGWQAEQKLDSTLVDRLTTLGTRAAGRLNERIGRRRHA